MSRRCALTLVSVLLACLVPRQVAASCGQAYCSVDSRLSTEAPLSRGGFRFDVSTEYIEQDQPWVEYHSAAVGAEPRPDHQEVSTTNLTVKLFGEVQLTDRWAFSLLLPIVHREHLHLETPSPEDNSGALHGGSGAHAQHDDPASEDGTVTIGDATGIPERWNFTNLGDLQVAARYSLLRAATPVDLEVTLFAGLKLPTGETNVRNDDGQEAEITLQPGTGSVAPLFGATLRRSFPVRGLDGGTVDVPVLLGTVLHTPGSDGRFGYRPGTELLLYAGAAYPLMYRLSALGQINFRYKDRDHVGDAPGVERADTGSEQLFLSPGLQVRISDQIGFYSYVQVPVLQRVNGIQLVSWWNLLLGIQVSLAGAAPPAAVQTPGQ